MPCAFTPRRLLGRDKTLVLHGGGNTSVKILERNLVGDEETVLYVKGSGWDLEHIEAAGFSPVRMQHLLRLAKLSALTDPEMVNELRSHTLRADAPTPSVEAILHAILPFKYVDHTHANAVLTLTNSADGASRIRDAVVGLDVNSAVESLHKRANISALHAMSPTLSHCVKRSSRRCRPSAAWTYWCLTQARSRPVRALKHWATPNGVA